MSFKTMVLRKKLTEISPSYAHAIGTKMKFLPVLNTQNNKAGTREGNNIFLRFYIIQSRKNLVLPGQASHVGICIVYNAQRRIFTEYFAIFMLFVN
jgi:hypothetical protein